MSAYDKARLVEARGMAVLEPYLRERADGSLVLFEKGPLTRILQESIGDGIFQMPNRNVWTVEIKVEEEERYGNLFLESWSNRNLEDRYRHAYHGSNPGWLMKLKADLLLYYFLNTDHLYTFDLFKLKRWAFESWRITRYPEKAQGKRAQVNDTWGWCVPLSDLHREVGYRLTFPKQLGLFGDASPLEAA